MLHTVSVATFASVLAPLVTAVPIFPALPIQVPTRDVTMRAAVPMCLIVLVSAADVRAIVTCVVVVVPLGTSLSGRLVFVATPVVAVAL